MSVQVQQVKETRSRDIQKQSSNSAEIDLGCIWKLRENALAMTM